MTELINKNGIPFGDILIKLDEWLASFGTLKRVLLIPPDITRKHSKAGEITSYIYKNLSGKCKVKLLIALGSHVGMNEAECAEMFNGVPFSDIINHDWRKRVVKIGNVPAEFVRGVSGGLCDFSIDVEVNKEFFNGYDKIVSIGQVVPHEVVGMANGNKNIFVGCGGDSMINGSHFLGAVCDMEKLMGKADTPVRRVFNYAEEKFLKNLDITYILDVLQNVNICGLFIGKGQTPYEEAAKLSQELNLTFLDKPLKKVVVNLDPYEYKSTWLGNKAIYRTRMAIADGGELLILAPGVERFGEDGEIDRLIKKYGYSGRNRVLELAKENNDLKDNLSAAAHLIHGSSNGRFSITYAVEKLSKDEIEGVGFKYADYADTVKKYNPQTLREGYNNIDGEEIFYISNPAVGLWAEKGKFGQNKVDAEVEF